MLTRKQARDQLKTFHLEDWKERRLASVATLPKSLREIGAAALDFGAGYGWTPEERERAAARWQALLRLDALGVPERLQLFSALWPHIGAHVEAAWQLRKRLPYQRSGHRRAFRAPNAPAVTLWTRVAWFDQLLRTTAGYEQNICWFATWAPYLGYGVDDLLGVLFAATIDAGGEDGRAVFDILTTSARGEHPIGAMGRHVSRALLTASRPEGWDFMEGMLLAAQRQEGLRQVILESIDEAHPLAFRRMLRLILERNLIRFSATVRAADVWFGLMWDVTSPRVITATLERALRYLDDADSRVKALNSDAAEDAYLALWATAFEDAPATIQPASRLLAEPNVERRFVGAHLLAMLGLPDAQRALIPALDDDDVRVTARAFMELRHVNPESVEADLFERLERNLSHFPRQKQALKPLVWPWMRLEATQADVAGALLHHLGQRSPKRLIPYLSVMDSGARASVARQLSQFRKWDAEVRDVFFTLVGDASPSVREAALHAIQSQSLGADEVIGLEKLLAREAGDLRRGVINLLLKLEDQAAFMSAQRLMASSLPQRLAGLELLRELQKANRASARCKAMALAYRDKRNTIAPAEAKLLDSLTAETDQSEVPTLENALGLLDPAQRTGPTPPVLKQRRGLWSFFVNESLGTPAARAMRHSLDELVHAHRETPITIEIWQGTQEELLGNVHWRFPEPHANVPLEKDLERLPLRDVWEAWWLKRPAAERDADGLEILRALAPGEFRVHPHFTHETPAWLQTVFAKLYGKPQEINYSPQVQTILLWLMRLHPPEGATDFLLDAVETTLALIPPQELARKSEPDRSGAYWHYADWRDNQQLFGWLHLARTHRALCPQDWTNVHHVRQWGLLRWMDEPGTDPSAGSGQALPRHRPPLEEALIAHRAGGATEADLLDHLLGPRPREGYFSVHSFHDLEQLTSRKPHPALAEFPVLRELADRCRERIIAVELRRGDLPTAASMPALNLRSAGGLKTLVQLLQAFSRGKFVRGWIHDSKSKDAVFSHLIRSTFPEDGDTPDSFTDQVKAAAISIQCLIELAMYAPQWASHVEQALGWPGLADGVWWIHAHTKDRYWRVDHDIREAWVAQISERTPLAGEDLLDGAVDVAWFQRIRQTLNGKRWEALYEAAVYASGGQGHGRARLFADAMMGRVTRADLVTRMMAKRHQDSARALGLLPLAKGKRGGVDVLERYKAIQEFRRGSRKFGSMRQASEKLAARIGLENLARTAQYADPVRLEWAMEARAVADLAQGPKTIKVGEVKVSLAIGDLGEPQLTITKAGRLLKSIPASIKKDPHVAELVERKREVEKQKSRMRQSLELAMCRGDTFTGAEMQALLDHPVLAPMLEQLVFLGDGLAGYPVKRGKALEAHDGTRRPVRANTVLRIAHPHDLLTTSEWHLWQRECFVHERIQPFKQVFRELYVVTPAEKAEGAVSQRYAGHQVNPRQAFALLTSRGWVSVPGEGVRRTFHDEGLSARLTCLNGAFTPAEVEGLTIEGVVFTRPGEWKPLNLCDVPPRVFSEVMRDVDLVVSVAHMGGVDPEASASTVEMRAALVRETCALLKIDNVRLNGTHVLVDGELGHYSVHLGSAVVHRQPGGALCIVPVHSQHRGRLFLPFADDDPKTAEVTSKVLLLARDNQIRDPTILEQILATH